MTPKPIFQKTDSQIMKMALSLARRGLGQVWPNPSVGCVIVDKAGHVIGRGLTGHVTGRGLTGRGLTGMGGRPHGEVIALKQAGEHAKGATVYVTLEPCAHHGETPPCAEALVEAGVGRVVIAVTDPDPRVSGRGIEILQQAGIEVTLDVCAEPAFEINAGFFSKIIHQRPLVTLKIASSLDGCIATATGQSKWITGPEARARGHLLRANHDAILVGIGTVLADNPALDCRLPGLCGRSPVRIVVDSNLKIPKDCKLVETADNIPTWIMTTVKRNDQFDLLEAQGVKIITVEADQQGRVSLPRMMAILAQDGLTRLLSEGGAQLNGALIRAGLADRLYWFRGGGIIGGDGLVALPSLGVKGLDDAADFCLVREGRTGQDSWQEYRKDDREGH